MPEEKIGDAVPADQKGSWGQFLKSIATFSGDLSSMTAPSFILSPVSLTEYSSYWGEQPHLLAKAGKGADDVEKIVSVLRWFIGTLKGQYTARNTSMGSEKKPLNPILGELFLGTWPDKDGRGETTLISEQVSHHPPITAYHLANQKAGISLEGHSGQKTSFSGRAVHVQQVGHATLRVKNDSGAEDVYLITLPNLVLEGLWYGAPYVEALGTSYICSSTGYLAKIDFTGKGYFSGKAHSYKATIAPVSQPTSALYSLEGEWAGVSSFKGKAPDGSKDNVFIDANKEPREEVTVKPLEEQEEMESRRVWKTVAEGIRTGNYEVASRDKSKIENDQRQKRKDETAAGTPHQLEYFVHVENDKEYEEFAAKFGGKPPTQPAYRRKPKA